MDRDLIKHGEPAFLTCHAVRVTPYGPDPRPDDTQAVTFWFNEPVTLVYIDRELLPEVTLPPHLFHRQVHAIAAFLAPDDHPQQKELSDLARLLRFTGSDSAVEIWTQHDGGWAYSLFPNWRPALADVWPYPPAPGVPVYCLGETAPSPSSWSSPAHVRPGYDVHAGSSFVLALGAAPPPPPGHATVSADTVRASGAVRRTYVLTAEDTDRGPCPTSADTGRTPADTPAADTPRTPRRRDVEDTRRTAADTDSGQGVRVEYRARVRRGHAGAALAEAFAHIARATRPDSTRTPADTAPPSPAERRSAIAAAFDLPERLIP